MFILVWQGKAADVILELQSHQNKIGLPDADTSDDDPREQLRLVIQYLMYTKADMHPYFFIFFPTS